MSPGAARALEETLFQTDGTKVEEWLRGAQSGEQTVPDGFNWPGFAEVAAQLARSEAPASALGWARVATSVYQQLATRSTGSTKESLEHSSMMLRAAMIRRFGPIPGDRVLDPDPIVRWFFGGVALSRQEAAAAATSWTSLPVARIRQLRRIKNRLNVIAVLREANVTSWGEELDAWLGLRGHLP